MPEQHSTNRRSPRGLVARVIAAVGRAMEAFFVLARVATPLSLRVIPRNARRPPVPKRIQPHRSFMAEESHYARSLAALGRSPG